MIDFFIQRNYKTAICLILFPAETGEIALLKSLDFESKSRYDLVIQVEDQGGFKSTTLLQINVSDANDLGPNFEFDQYQFEVLENSPGKKSSLIFLQFKNFGHCCSDIGMI